MKQPSKKEIELLKKEVSESNKWEETSSFNASKANQIRLPDELIEDLQKIAELRGEKNYQVLLKRWLLERAKYEIELVDLARKR